MNCKEYDDYVLRQLPEKFENILQVSITHLTPKHGKDLADSSINIARSLCDHLKVTDKGFMNPRRDLSRMQKNLDERQIAANLVHRDRGDCLLLYVKALTPPLLYNCLNLEYCDSSHCRKAVRAMPSGPLTFSEHFRFDCEVGIQISAELITVKRLDTYVKVANALEDEDKFVCSVEKQMFRQQTTTSILNYIENHSEFSCAAILRGELDEKFDFRTVPVGKPVLFQSQIKKKQGRPVSKRAPVRSRQTLISDRPAKKAKIWNTESAVERVIQMATFIGSRGSMPTRSDFQRQGELYLWRLIFERRSFGSIAAFTAKCKLQFL